MRRSFAARRIVWLLGLILAASGCAESPLLVEMAAWNPYLRKKWAEDEQYGPTFHARMEEMRAVRDGFAGLSPQQQTHLAQQLADIARRDPSPLLRREAVLTLSVFPASAADDVLREAGDDPDTIVRLAAVQAWGRRSGPDAATMLASILGRDQDQDVRIAATKELEKFNDPGTVQALAGALDDSDPALQYRAMQSLKAVTRRDYGNNVAAWREYLRGGTPTYRGPSLVERFTSWF
jgi:hypothetical protein